MSLERAFVSLVLVVAAGCLLFFVGFFLLPVFLAGFAVYLYLHHKYHNPVYLEAQARQHTQALYDAVAAKSAPSREDFEDFMFGVFEMPAIVGCAAKIYDMEGFERPPPPPAITNSIEGARYRDRLSRFGAKDIESYERFKITVAHALHYAYDFRQEGEFDVVAPLTGKMVEDIAAAFYVHDDLFVDLKAILDRNLAANKDELPGEGKAPPLSYLAGTPLYGLQHHAKISLGNRFEHTHIVAGSGHGKTQTLQYLIARDLEEDCSIVVIDSQNQLINNIAHLDIPKERLVWLDPTDIEYPPALNLFDVGMERINAYAPLERERALNQIIELYDFVLGALLGSEMTSKQSVVFRYITRLMLHIPNATIHTLLEIMRPDAPVRFASAIAELPPTARQFFETEFMGRQFNETKEQVLRRLYGILENSTFERMMSHPKNKVDFFAAMNEGKVIIVNTARDFLMEQGTQIFGRFIIAMVRQAVQERATLAQNKPCYVYIDEFADYLSESGEDGVTTMLTQARKYNVGLTLSHQYMGQLSPKLQQAIASNTSTKLAGGVSPADARLLAPQLRTTPEFLLAQKTGSFATFSKGNADAAVSLTIPFGVMEALPQTDDIAAVRQHMRDCYAAPRPEPEQEPQRETQAPPSDPDPAPNLKPEPAGAGGATAPKEW